MASLQRDERTNKWRVMFRYGGKQFCKSTKSASERDALTVKARIEETVRLLERGSVQMPPDADTGTWIFSGGVLAEKVKLASDGLTRLGEICEAYLGDQQAKATSTVKCEQIHVRHLKRVLKASAKFSTINLATLQAYVNARRGEKWREKAIGGKTIRKELVTFDQIWDWARARHLVRSRCPIYDEVGKWAVQVPQDIDRLPFMPLGEIKKRIERGEQEKDLRAALFLDEGQVEQLLAYASGKQPFLVPMLAMAAYAGLRRSEIVRACVDDFDFVANQLRVRERKRKKSKAESVRFVPIRNRLAEIMRSWFAVHPGGQFAVGNGKPLTVDAATHYFKNAVSGSPWSIVRGFHVLRHSFGANCLRAGIPRDMTGKWMGHTSEEMKDLYQHLFPEDEQAMIKRLG